ncbi:MAG: hypothetical protein HKN26_06990 [Acidimicrobiales bacterium]|nr:hypothetical protein [Acidimicrobiales bacterium]
MKHAQGYAEGFPAGVTLGIDIGSGGGLPGLVLAWTHADMEWLLVDGRKKSIDFLTGAIEELGLVARVTAHQLRLEEFGRLEQHRGVHQLVVARSFGPPAVVAECAAPLLAPGGRLLVSEPPPPGVAATGSDPSAPAVPRGDETSPSRWPADGLELLGMRPGHRWVHEGSTYQAIEQVSPCGDRYPRRVGIPTKRPLF